MYQCQSCKQQLPPHTQLQKLIVETRQAEYPVRPRAHLRRRERRRLSRRMRERPAQRFQLCERSCRCCDRGGAGQEIARELWVCPACAEAASARQRELPRQQSRAA